MAEQEGIPVAGVVCSAMGDSAIYLFGATSDQGLTTRGAYLLQWAMIQWLKDRGTRWYDLCGIDPIRNPGGYSFKKGLSGADVSHLAPMLACDSIVSTAFVKAGLAMRQSIRSVAGNLRGARLVSQEA